MILEQSLSRIINPDSVGKDRARLSKAIVLAVRELAKQTEVGQEAKDLAAFISLALKTISEGIDSSVAAWEKRDYWVKAEEFRQRWSWAGDMADSLQVIVYQDDWARMPLMIESPGSVVVRMKVTMPVSTRAAVGLIWPVAMRWQRSTSWTPHS